ncbi:hypothetical protein Anas_04470 [Armadillidium nasatum]|uniref:Uncharacterized protein n=1 Tax=Armadillidium nasatum TaxID=96803 RepID=A0A5N5TN55_9CRUS|nr:hypothetical protein Anas_04470 [Armadillidium nasatum]
MEQEDLLHLHSSVLLLTNGVSLRWTKIIFPLQN